MDKITTISNTCKGITFLIGGGIAIALVSKLGIIGVCIVVASLVAAEIKGV